MIKSTALFVLTLFSLMLFICILPREADAYVSRLEARSIQRKKIAMNPPKKSQVLGVKAQPTEVSYEQKKQFIMNAINSFRISKGLSQIQPDSNTCNFAKKRAQELTTSYNHDGFSHLPYSSYSLVTENIAQTGNYQDVVSIWINSPAHAENMQKDTPYVCVEFVGNFYAYEGWKP